MLVKRKARLILLLALALLVTGVATMFIIAGVAYYFFAGDNPLEWKVINKTALPIDLYRNGAGGPVMRPGETRSSFGGIPDTPELGPPLYTFKAYEFLKGQGGIPGWREDNKTIYGERGELVFCITYTWWELKLMNFVITVTRNVISGIQDDPKAPCLET